MSPILKRKPQTPIEEKQLRREREQKVQLVDPVVYTRQRVDVDSLSVEECAELATLHEKARDRQSDGTARAGLEALSAKEKRRFVELLDRGLPEAERAKRQAVREERERRALQAFADEIANEGVPPAKRLGLRSGEVVLAADVFTLGTLHLADVGLLAAILHAWSSGIVPFKDARWSDDGSALLAPKRLQLVDGELNRTYDGEGLPTSLVNLDRTLEHLTRNEFLDAKRDGSGWVVRLGPRLAEPTS